MFTHKQLWRAIDQIAEQNNLSLGGLANAARLDPSVFTRSKRFGKDGREHWPSTQSVARALMATGTPMDVFASMLMLSSGFSVSRPTIPLIGMAKAGSGGFFDDAGFPVGGSWEEIDFPGVDDENAYALEISGDSMEPVYRDGDILIVSPNASYRRGDRVVVKTLEGEVLFKILKRQTARTIELKSYNAEHDDIILDLSQIDWIARVLWVGQ